MRIYVFILPAWVATHSTFWTSTDPFFVRLREYLARSAALENPGVVLTGREINEKQGLSLVDEGGEDRRFLFLIEQAVDDTHKEGNSYVIEAPLPKSIKEAGETDNFLPSVPKFRAVVPTAIESGPKSQRRSHQFQAALKKIPTCAEEKVTVGRLDELQQYSRTTANLSGVFRAVFKMQIATFPQLPAAVVENFLFPPVENPVEDWGLSSKRGHKKSRFSILSKLHYYTIGLVQRHPWRAAAFVIFAGGVAAGCVLFPPLIAVVGFVATHLPLAAAIATALTVAVSSLVVGALGVATQMLAASLGRCVQRSRNKDSVVVVRRNPMADRLRQVSASGKASYSQSAEGQLRDKLSALLEQKNGNKYLKDLHAIAEQALGYKITVSPKDFHTDICALLLTKPVLLKGAEGAARSMPGAGSVAHDFLEYFKSNVGLRAAFQEALQHGWANCGFCPKGGNRRLPALDLYFIRPPAIVAPLSEEGGASMYSLLSVPSTGAASGSSAPPLLGAVEDRLPSSSHSLGNNPVSTARHRSFVGSGRRP